jgi:hypothetical protein
MRAIKVRGAIRSCTRMLRAPISDVECVAYEVVVRARPTMAEGASGASGIVARESDCASFEIARTEGLFLVDVAAPCAVALQLTARTVPFDLTAGSSGVSLVNFLSRPRARTFPGLLAPGTRYDVYEGTVGVGDTVAVRGIEDVRISPDLPSEGYRQPPMRKIITGTEQHPLRISNRLTPELLDRFFQLLDSIVRP